MFNTHKHRPELHYHTSLGDGTEHHLHIEARGKKVTHRDIDIMGWYIRTFWTQLYAVSREVMGQDTTDPVNVDEMVADIQAEMRRRLDERNER